MRPQVIMHNSVSLDGSFLHFEIDMRTHYQIAGNYNPDIHLIGSNTAKIGVDSYYSEIPEENESDFQKPKKEPRHPYWVVVDTKGKLEGLLHVYRRFEYCRDVVVLISRKTPESYRDYLSERSYDFHEVGEDYINYEEALDLLAKEYHAKTVLTDTGRTLGNILCEQGLVDEISLIIQPVVVGEKTENLFSNISNPVSLKKIQCKDLRDGCVWVSYGIV